MLPSDTIKAFRITRGTDFGIDRLDPDGTGHLDLDKKAAKKLLASATKRLAELQERLYADRRWAVLVILQGLDASGKDSLIEHVLSGVNPQGCEVHSFGPPNDAERAHDFLWRTTLALPARGRIGVFNRSYYEETLVVRVHPELLARQNLPDGGDGVWTHRFEAIRAHETHLRRNGTLVLKFFLNISPEEQARRLLDRIDENDKHWKFQAADLAERKLWDQYLKAYEDTIRHTATKDAPWYAVPADHKWFARLVVASALVEQMEALDLRYPIAGADERRAMAQARADLAAQLPTGGTKSKSKKSKAEKSSAKADAEPKSPRGAGKT
jgi:PPK2 family polyphosphate:nucleotide phosphotransferase